MMRFLLLLVASFSLHSALPVTHLYFGKMWRESDPHFLAGVLFPDIRYIAAIPRETTHPSPLPLEAIAAMPNLFEQGVQLHVWVDTYRDDLVQECGLDHRFRGPLLKLLEDEIFYDQTNTLDAIAALQEIYEEELLFEINRDTVQQWHQMLTRYLKVRPSVFLKELASKGKGFFSATPEEVQEWSQHLTEWAQLPEIQAYVQQLTYRFQHELP